MTFRERVHQILLEELNSNSVEAILQAAREELVPEKLNRNDVYAKNPAAEWRDIGFNQCSEEIKKRIDA